MMVMTIQTKIKHARDDHEEDDADDGDFVCIDGDGDNGEDEDDGDDGDDGDNGDDGDDDDDYYINDHCINDDDYCIMDIPLNLPAVPRHSEAKKAMSAGSNGEPMEATTSSMDDTGTYVVNGLI